MRSEHVFLTCGVLAAIGGTIWHVSSPAPLAHVLIEDDISKSVQPNCSGLRDAAKSVLANKPGIRDGSQLAMLVTGADSNNPSPKLAFSGPVPVPSDLVYGQDKAAFANAQDQFFGQIVQACQAAKTGRVSPLYALVHEGIAHLRGGTMNCGSPGPCYLLAKTDLAEDQHPALRAALARAIKDPAAILPPELAGSIDNAGIEVTFCGIAESRAMREGSSPSAPIETRMRVWKQVFTKSDLVSFQPYCSR